MQCPKSTRLSIPMAQTWSLASGFLSTSSTQTVLLLATRLDGLFMAILNNLVLTLTRLSIQSSNPPPFMFFSVLSSLALGLFINLISRTPFFMAILMRIFIANNLLALFIRSILPMSIDSKNPCTDSNKHLVPSISVLPHTFALLALLCPHPTLLFLC